jgi:hypothetical protein
MVPRHRAIGADDLMANDYQRWKVFDRLVRVERPLELRQVPTATHAPHEPLGFCLPFSPHGRPAAPGRTT